MSIQRTAARSRLVAGLGVAAAAVPLVGILAAAALAPWFSPFEYALSDLGAAGEATAPVFNGGLLVGGALGAGFIAAVWTETENGLRAGGLVFLGLASVCVGLTGSFALPDPLHYVVAPGIFAFLTVGALVWGLGDWAAGRPARGGAFVVAAALHVAAWLWWALLGWAGPGIAVPELVGSGTLALWFLWLSVERWPHAPERSQL